MAMTHGNTCYLNLNNGKFVYVDVVCEDSLDVICRLIRLNIAQKFRHRRNFIINDLKMPIRRHYMAWRDEMDAKYAQRKS